jgi:hypothetical protein
LIKFASDSSSPGSKFLVVERDQDKVIDNTKRLLSEAGLTLGDLGKTSTNMDRDERMEDLEPYITQIGRRPRLQWGSRSGRGAFYVVGTKP